MTDSTRRRILGAVAAAPVGAFLMSSAPALGDPRHSLADSRRWWRLHARWTRSREAAERYYASAEAPAYEAYKAAADAIPHYTTQATYETMGGVPGTMTTAQAWQVRLAREMVSDHPQATDDFTTACRELLAAHERREATIKQLRESSNLDAIEAKFQRMDRIADALLNRLLAMPAPDARAALWKYDYLVGWDEGPEFAMPAWIKNGAIGVAMADVRRFLGAEA